MSITNRLKPVSSPAGFAGACWLAAAYLVASSAISVGSWFITGSDGSGVVGPFVVALKLFAGISLFRLLENSPYQRPNESPEGMLR